jgi:hypothetical protein
MGTPLYMSPEQVKGKPVDGRSDLYSLGVTAYHMIAGEPPYTGDTALAVAIQHVQGNAVPLHDIRKDVSHDLCALVHRLIAVKPEDRPQSAREVLKELNKIRSGAGQIDFLSAPSLSAKDVSPTQSFVQPAGKTSISLDLSKVGKAIADERRRAWMLPLTIVLATVLGGGVGWTQRERNPLTATVVESKSRRPSTKDVELLEDPVRELQQARSKDNSEAERIKRLWAVIDHHGGGGDPPAYYMNPTLDAAMDLFEYYLDRCDYDAINELAATLKGENDRGPPEQRTYAALFRGIVQSRLNKPVESNKSFSNALRTMQKEPLNLFKRPRIRKLAIEFVQCIEKNGELPAKQEGASLSAKELTKEFWARFTPPVPRPQG